jgi:hypothetical protein
VSRAAVDQQGRLRSLLASDPRRLDVLRQVRALGLPDCWVGAGFVRNCVWDHLHGHPASPVTGDVDVVWYDPERATPALDGELEARLHVADGSLAWSVKNQARMHRRNGDAPYHSTIDAMRHWPETATAVGVRLDQRGEIELAAPFGLGDLFGLRVRPTPHFRMGKPAIYRERLISKNWLAAWPELDIELAGDT